MLGTAIKNTILFLLIILILHFLINNVLVEKKILNNKNLEKKKVVKKEEKNINSFNEDIDLDLPKPENGTNNNVIKVDNMKELYDYVFNEDARDDLNKYYNVDNNVDNNNNKDAQVKCAEELGSNKNFCMTTKPTQEELKAHYGNFDKVQCEGEISQDKHVYLVNKFENEKPINGGAEDASNITGFDGFDTTFDTY
jgi:hypothetical protein